MTDRVVRVELPLPIPELRSVNSYLVLGDDGVTLIDPGWASAESAAVMVEALTSLGLGLSDVVRILVTHHHWDHYTQALVWRRDLGVPVLLGREEQHSIQAWHDLDGAFPEQVDLLRRAGADELAVEVSRMPVEPEERDMDFDVPDGWLGDGDLIDCGGVRLSVLATPGHTRGHVVFADEASGLYFTGDHILPGITPSIAYERAPVTTSLVSYLGSLRLFLERPDGRMLPAHRTPEPSTRARAVELLDHHRQRLDIVGDLVAAGATTAHDVASRMRWTRHDRALEDLGLVHEMTAILEVAAHLTLLELDGLLTRDDDEVDRYAVS